MLCFEQFYFLWDIYLNKIILNGVDKRENFFLLTTKLFENLSFAVHYFLRRHIMHCVISLINVICGWSVNFKRVLTLIYRNTFNFFYVFVFVLSNCKENIYFLLLKHPGYCALLWSNEPTWLNVDLLLYSFELNYVWIYVHIFWKFLMRNNICPKFYGTYARSLDFNDIIAR